jgi:hypothetical protein
MADNPYSALRTRAITLKPSDVSVTTTPEFPDVFGLVVDMPVGANIASLAALSDGATSLYFSNGGGAIGLGEHATIASATHTLLLSTQANLDSFEAGPGNSPLADAQVRFTVLTFNGRRMLTVPIAALGPTGVGRVWADVQGVLSAYRLSVEA